MLIRRLLLSVASLALCWLAIELYFGSRAPSGRVSSDGEELLPTFEPTSEQLGRWRRRLERLRKIDAGQVEQSSARVLRFSERYGWTHATQTRGNLMGTQVSINSIGARGEREFAEQPNAGVLRVACYGESFTFCTEVEDGQDWPTQLDAGGDGEFEVINLGVSGWGTDQALMRFRDTHDDLAPDIVLMGIMSENIQRNVNRLVSVRAPSEILPLVKPRFLLEDGELQLLPQPYATEIELFEAATGGSLGFDLAEHEWLAESSERPGWSNMVKALRAKRERAERGRWWLQWKDPDGEPFQVTVALLEALHREAVSAGATVAGVVIFPAKADLSDPARRLTTLHAALDQRGIPYIDLYDLMSARRERGVSTYGQTHLTADANAEVAGAVLEFLKLELER